MYGRVQSKRDERLDDKKLVPDLHPSPDAAPPPVDEIPSAENAAEVERHRREGAKGRERTRKGPG